MVNIGALSGEGDDDAAAVGLSDNGKIVVGISAPRPLTLGNLGYDWGTDTHGFRWTQAGGMQDLTALLSAAGVNMTGIKIVAVTGISPDGQFMGGQATTPTTPPNETIAFIAQYCDSNIGAACQPQFVTHDFNFDGKSDILWRNTGGAVAAWLMNGGAVSQSAVLGAVPGTFSIIGQQDFNGDGNADMVWRDLSGNVSMWLMSGASVASAAAVSTVASNWTLYGTGDLNFDGDGDLLWRDTAGDLAVWFMNGGTVTSSASLGNVPTNWTIVGDDDVGDIFWRDSAGDLAVWVMNGAQVATSVALGTVSSNWQIAGLGDFDGDGNTDILWRDTNTGTLSIWFTNASSQVASAATVAALPSNWSVAQIGDYNGDGKSDILLIDSAGDLAVWEMNGSAVSSSVGIGNVGTTWTVQNVNAN